MVTQLLHQRMTGQKTLVTTNMAQNIQTGVNLQSGFVPAPIESPFGNFAPTPYGGTVSPEPIQQAAAVAGPVPNPVQSPIQPPAPAANPNAAIAQKVMGLTASAASGFGAGSQVEQTPYVGDAVLQTAGSTLAGAAQGAAIGSVIPGVGTAVGAGVGAVVGLVSGGINSYLGLRRARAQRRQQERQLAEIRKMQKEEKDYQRMIDARNRGDKFEEMRYNRSLTSAQSIWAAHNQALSRFNDVIKNDADFRDRFIRGQR